MLPVNWNLEREEELSSGVSDDESDAGSHESVEDSV